MMIDKIMGVIACSLIPLAFWAILEVEYRSRRK